MRWSPWIPTLFTLHSSQTPATSCGYGCASQIHVIKISSTCRRVSSASLCVTSPRIRIASPGLGNGCRFRNDCGIPRKPPSLRSSSLSNHLSGSTVFNRMIAGNSPTLWWLLFSWELPCDGEISFPVDSSERGGHDSITVGYIVPCIKNSSVILSFFPNKSPNSWKTAIHLVPLIFRFVSGSSTPFNLWRNHALSLMHVTGKWSLASNVAITLSPSLYRNKPLSINTM